MKNLLYKELKMAVHPACYIFLALSAMLLIPSYPYYVAFFYPCLGVFFIFIQGRETGDVIFTTLLPIPKRDAVRARVMLIICLELAQVFISIPFAVLGVKINPNPGGNMAGIEANVAFYGLVFIMYGVFNLVFLPRFYKTAYKAGSSFVIATILMSLYVGAAEFAVNFIPSLKAALDTTVPAMQLRQIPILAGGIGLFALANLLAYRLSARNFEAVDL